MRSGTRTTTSTRARPFRPVPSTLLLVTLLLACGSSDLHASDFIHDDDVLMSSLCASFFFHCEDGEIFTYFGSFSGLVAAAKLKGGQPAIVFEDHQDNDADWVAGVDNIGEAPEESFVIGNLEWSSVPFVIENGAANNLLVLDSNERVGIRTNTPLKDLEIEDSLPEIRLDDSSFGAGQAYLQMSTNTFTIEGNSEQDVIQMETTAPGGSLTVEADGRVVAGHDFAVLSSRASKNDVRKVDRSHLLRRLAELPIASWTYEGDAEAARHVGPMAEDFHALFGLGADGEHLHPTDLAGVSLAAIQGLVQLLEEREAHLARQEAEIERLRDRVETAERASSALGEELSKRVAELEARLRQVEGGKAPAVP